MRSSRITYHSFAVPKHILIIIDQPNIYARVAKHLFFKWFSKLAKLSVLVETLIKARFTRWNLILWINIYQTSPPTRRSIWLEAGVAPWKCQSHERWAELRSLIWIQGYSDELLCAEEELEARNDRQ